MPSINFPNSPVAYETYLDVAGRLWRFIPTTTTPPAHPDPPDGIVVVNNGYWKEVIVPFTIDLLRDVLTIDDTQSITFVSYNGVETSVNANIDFPFVGADNSVQDIEFSPYGLPFYTSALEYDEIDIVKYTPDIGSSLVWDGEKWLGKILTYEMSDITDVDSENAVEDDILVWDTDRYVIDQKINHNTYPVAPGIARAARISDVNGTSIYTDDVWYTLSFEIIEYQNDVLMTTDAKKLICTESGLYRIQSHAWISGAGTYSGSSTVYHEFRIFDINDVNYRTYRFYNSKSQLSWHRYAHSMMLDTMLNNGDYMQVRVYHGTQKAGVTHKAYGSMSMRKLTDLPTSQLHPVKLINIDASVDTLTTPVTLELSAGTYEIEPFAGTYKAADAWGVGGVGCDINGENCTNGYSWHLVYSSPEVSQTIHNSVSGLEYFETDQQALDDILTRTNPTFTLTYDQTMSFWYPDTTYPDNVGGISFRVIKTS